MSQKDDDNVDKAVEFMMKQVDTQGAAASTVKDGHIVILNRQYLKDLLEKKPNSDKLIIFIQRPDFKN